MACGSGAEAVVYLVLLSLAGTVERPVRHVERRLHHGWQLQFMVVGFIAFFTTVSLSASHELLTQLDLGSRWRSWTT